MTQLIKITVVLLALITMSQYSQAQTNAINSADLYIKQGNFQKAIDELTEHIDINPADAQAYVKRAVAYEILGQKALKEKDLQYANYLNPFSYMYLSNTSRSAVYDKKKYDYNFDQSSESFKKSPVKNNYYNLYLKDQLGIHAQDSLIEQVIYSLSTSDIENAERLLVDIEETENISGIINDIKGIIELKKNNLDEAIDYFTLSINKMPNFPLAYHNRAIAYKMQGNYEEAKNDLTKAISLNENISVFYFTLAKLSERLEDPSEAIYNYKKAIDRNPNYIEARTNYSVLQKTLGNYDEAISGLNAITRSDDNSNNSFIKGGIHLTYGEYENAIKEFDKYLIKNSNDSDAIFNRGLAKILSGYKIDGCEDIETSIDLISNEKRIQIFDSFCPN
jgi:tetratricopeptide (TPR) repeat protein